jgi:hypothetical protein
MMGVPMNLYSIIKHRGIVFLILANCLILATWSLHAEAGWKTQREALDRRLVQGEFMIYYTQQGENAFPPAVPPPQRTKRTVEMLDSLAAQISQASSFYNEQLGLTPPPKNARYREVRSIDIHILKLKGKMGDTGDAPIVYRYKHFDGKSPALTISLSNQWSPPNLTPSHEIFHAYQYGYTYFKTSWFLEGMARGLEKAFKSGKVLTESLPREEGQLQQMMARSYGAYKFWNRLMYLCDASCSGSTPAMAWKGEGYIPRTRFCGGGLIRATLEQYQALDKEAARSRGIAPNNWPEKEQRSDRNNPLLLRGLRNAIESQCPVRGNPELEAFQNLLKKY